LGGNYGGPRRQVSMPRCTIPSEERHFFRRGSHTVGHMSPFHFYHILLGGDYGGLRGRSACISHTVAPTTSQTHIWNHFIILSLFIGRVLCGIILLIGRRLWRENGAGREGEKRSERILPFLMEGRVILTLCVVVCCVCGRGWEGGGCGGG
jgi:hypothetical protein